MSERWIRMLRIATSAFVLALACGAARADLLGFLGGGSKPDTTEEWLKARKTEFAKWQAEHPGIYAGLAELTTRSNELAAADAAIPPTPRYADLIARSRAVSPAQIAKAQEIFLTAFTLWRDGDFKSAEIAFREGLAIDPANGVAHYYLGEILQRRDEPDEAAGEMDKAVVLAPASAESFKARSALQELPRQLPPELAAPARIFRVSNMLLELWECPECPRLVFIPAGKFTMGSPTQEKGRRGDVEGPLHRVSIRAFALAKTEVTRGQFAAFLSASGYSKANGCRYVLNWNDTSHDWRNPGYAQGENEPAVCVSWDDAQAYVRWLSQRTGKNYRLPSEAEWEYSARGGTSAARYWGDDPDRACEYANVADLTYAEDAGEDFNRSVAHQCRDGKVHTAPVGSFRPNSFGLHDMIGNVAEWNEDCFSETYTSAPDDGSAWKRGNCGKRIIRGGAWWTLPLFSRTATRITDSPATQTNSTGFRVARSLP